MRENGEGRDKVPPWSVAQRVCGAIDGWPGTVVSVDAERGTFEVKWSDGMYPITYPMDTAMVRKAWPWE